MKPPCLTPASVSSLKSLRQALPDLLDSMPDVLWVTDHIGNPQFISKNIERVFGCTQAEVCGSGPEIWFGRIHRDDLGGVKDAFSRVAVQGDGFDREYRVRRKDGRWIWIHGRAIAVARGHREPALIYGLLSDITARKLAELLRADQARVLERVAQGAPLEETLTALARSMETQLDGLLASVLLLSPDGKHLLHGAAPSLPPDYYRMLDGMPIGPNVGSCGTAAYRGESVVVADIATDPRWAGCAQLGLRHGLRACWSQPIFSSKSRVLGTFALYCRTPREPTTSELELITASAHVAGIAIERELQERQLRSAKEEAEASSRFKSDFLAAMSHEIRTPMTAILGYTDFLCDGQGTPEERASYLSVIRENGLHLLAVINDILDLSKIEAGKLAVERLRCSPRQIVDKVISLLSTQARDKGVELLVEFHEPLPAEIQTDPTRLRQILLNLVGNAIKFTRHGTVLIAVNLIEIPDTPSATICFEVIDTGPGLTAEQRSRLFEPYRQANASVARLYGGTGLGLSISKRLAKLLGGDIVVQSEPGAGSSFLLSIDTGIPGGAPVQPVETIDPFKPPAHDQIRISGRALLAEDVQVNQKLISHLLRKAGLDVEIVDNGRDAVNRALEALESGSSFDIILMDMQMPILDGLGATKELRQAGYSGAIVALTANVLTDDRERCLAAGCDGFLTKPVNRQELIETTRNYCTRPSKS